MDASAHKPQRIAPRPHRNSVDITFLRAHGTETVSEVNVLVSELPNLSIGTPTCRLRMRDAKDFLADRYITRHFFPLIEHLAGTPGVKEFDGRKDADQCQCYHPLTARDVRKR